VDLVACAGALERASRRLQCRGAELADARVELLVALPDRLDLRRAEGRARRGEALADHPAVRPVVVAQAGEVEERGPDVGLVDPRTGRAAVGHGRLAAVR